MTKTQTYEYLSKQHIRYKVTEHKAVYHMGELEGAALPYLMAYNKPLQFSSLCRMEVTAVLYFCSLDTIFEENMRVSRGMQSLGSGFPITLLSAR